MSIAWNYLDKRSAAMAALKDYRSMKAILATTAEEIANVRQDMVRIGGMRFEESAHGARNPQAGENQILHGIAEIDVLEERNRQAEEFMAWFQPAWDALGKDGDLTPEKVEIVRESDAVLREEIAKAGLDADIHQYFTVLTGIRSVGVMGDERTYDYTVAIRAVTTDDFMTADWARIPYDVVRTISARIVNEVPHVNRVVLDVTTKPPASIEWE